MNWVCKEYSSFMETKSNRYHQRIVLDFLSTGYYLEFTCSPFNTKYLKVRSERLFARSRRFWPRPPCILRNVTLSPAWLCDCAYFSHLKLFATFICDGLNALVLLPPTFWDRAWPVKVLLWNNWASLWSLCRTSLWDAQTIPQVEPAQVDPSRNFSNNGDRGFGDALQEECSSRGGHPDSTSFKEQRRGGARDLLEWFVYWLNMTRVRGCCASSCQGALWPRGTTGCVALGENASTHSLACFTLGWRTFLWCAETKALSPKNEASEAFWDDWQDTKTEKKSWRPRLQRFGARARGLQRQGPRGEAK